MTPSPIRAGLAVSLASAAAALAGSLALWQPSASAGQPRPGGPGSPGSPVAEDAMQVLADVVLIEAECRRFNVDYGKLFAFAERNGIHPVDIMPLGERRAAFDAAYRRRARDAKGERLCGVLAEERDDTVPGVLLPR